MDNKNHRPDQDLWSDNPADLDISPELLEYIDRHLDADCDALSAEELDRVLALEAGQLGADTPLSGAETARILSLEQEKVRHIRFSRAMKYVSAVAACFVVAIGVMLLVPNDPINPGGVGIQGFEETTEQRLFDSLADAEEHLGGHIPSLAEFPDGYALSSVAVSGDTIEIRYSHADSKCIHFYTGPTGDANFAKIYGGDLSGYTTTKTNGGATISTDHAATVRLAFWEADNREFMLFLDPGLPIGAVTDMVDDMD